MVEDKNKEVLYVDDNADLRELIGDYLTDMGYKVDFACDGLEGIDKIVHKEYAFVITDLDMPKLNGIEFIRQLRINKPYIPVCILSGRITNFATELVSLAVTATIPKPFTPHDIERAVAKLCEISLLFDHGDAFAPKTVEKVMRKDLLTAKPSTTIAEAVHGMAQNNVGAILVTSENARLLGIFTERVFLQLGASGSINMNSTMEKVMVTDMMTIKPGDTIDYAEMLIISKRLRYLPVLRGETLVGLLSSGEISASRLTHLKGEIELKIRQLNDLISQADG